MRRPAVLVTGGARRIGAAIARRFAAAGWRVIIQYHSSQADAEGLIRALPEAQAVRCDLNNPVAARRLAQDLAAELPDWRCLINNAAIFPEDSVTALDPATNSEVMLVNAASPALLAQAYLAKARSAAGRRVIQITDQKLANMNPDFFSYTMSKAAADAAAQMLAQAAGPLDRVYRLAPGAILPSHDQSEAEADRSHRLNPLARRTEAAEVADAAFFLAAGSLANGQVLYVDSGQHLLAQPRDVIYLEREGSPIP